MKSEAFEAMHNVKCKRRLVSLIVLAAATLAFVPASEARGWFQKSMDIWASLKAGGKFTSVEYGGPETVQREIARCDVALAGMSAASREALRK